MEDHELRHLIADRSLRAPSTLAFLWLWLETGGRPGKIIVSKAAWAEGVGVSVRTVDGYLKTLQAHDLVRVRETYHNRGALLLDVYNPAPGPTAPMVDPQARLFGPAGSGTPPGRDEDQSQGASILRCDASDQSQERYPAHSDSDQSQEGSKERPVAGVAARETPGVAARETPIARPAQPTQVPAYKEVAARVLPPRSGVAARQPPDFPHGTIETRSSITPHNHRTTQSMDHGERGGSCEPTSVGVATVELLRELTGRDPQKRRAKKAELVAYIEQGVADPKMEPSIPRRAADAVIEYGLPVAALEDLVQAVARKRQHKTVDKPGAYFLARIRKICRQHGVRFTEPGRTYAARVES